MTNDNTKPEFFALWSIRQLQAECARLNQVLFDCSKTISEATEEFDSDGEYDKQKDLEAMNMLDDEMGRDNQLDR